MCAGLARGAHTRGAIMTKRVPTCVSTFVAVLALAFVLVLPAGSSANSITPLFDTTIAADGTLLPFEGEFAWDNDVAFFRFELDEGFYDLTAITSSWAEFGESGFDPVLSLYAAPLSGGATTLYTYIGADGAPVSAIFDDIDPDSNRNADLALRLSAGFYTLALTQALNFPHEDFTFDWDDDSFKCTVSVEGGDCVPLFDGRSAFFAGTVQITPVGTTPVPEPGTLSLLALGSLATAFVRRRRTRTNSTRT